MNQKLETIITNINESTAPLQEFVDGVVSEYCKELDAYMQQVDTVLCEEKEPPTSLIEEMLLNINSLLYWAGNGLTEATIKESLAKMLREERYNKAYGDAQGTIGDKKALATLHSQQEDIVRLCYSNAVKMYQHKIDKASEMVSALKKILTHRISEMGRAGVNI